MAISLVSPPPTTIVCISPSRPAKRRRITPTYNRTSAPTVWATSQCVLAPAELHALLVSAGMPAGSIDTTHLTTRQLQIPKGLQPLEWLLPLLSSSIPPDLELPSEIEQLIAPRRTALIPEVVTYQLQLLPLSTLHLPIPVEKNVYTLRLRRSPTPAATAAAIAALLPKGQEFLYRGADLGARGFFTPILPQGATAELGAGLYTTPSLEYAVHLAGITGSGVVYVFQLPPVQALSVTRLQGKEWSAVVSGAARGKLGRLVARADVLVGAVSRDAWAAREEGRRSREDAEIGQVVWKSGGACARVAEGVGMVVFLED